jgi:hypothetical protein
VGDKTRTDGHVVPEKEPPKHERLRCDSDKTFCASATANCNRSLGFPPLSVGVIVGGLLPLEASHSQTSVLGLS